MVKKLLTIIRKSVSMLQIVTKCNKELDAVSKKKEGQNTPKELSK